MTEHESSPEPIEKASSSDVPANENANPASPEPKANGTAESSSEVALTSSDKKALDALSPSVAKALEELSEGGINQRRSRWVTSADALRYIGTLTRTDGVKIRDSDRATSIALLIVTILTIVAPWVRPLSHMRGTLFILCDIFVGAVIFFYAVNRFGIINTLTPRQAILCWQLMLVFVYVGVFLTVNMGYIIGLVIANTSIQVPH